MKRVLVLDGGGIKGTMQTEVLVRMEREIGKPLSSYFDLIAGSSVGAIIGGMIASDRMSMEEFLDLFYDVVPRLFKPRPLLFNKSKYSRKPLTVALERHLGAMKMGECKTKFMCTSVDLCDGRTHFFKSWEPKDGNIVMRDAITRTYAAPMYFGPVIDYDDERVWMDGGTGIENCPILEALVEIVDQGWLADGKVEIVSIGTGVSNHAIPFKKAKRYGWLRQIGAFIDPKDGGLGRQEAVQNAVHKAKQIAGDLVNLTVTRWDVSIKKETDRLDGRKYMSYYRDRGIEMWQKNKHTIK